MAELDKTIASLSERLQSIRSEFEAGLAALSADLDQAQVVAEKLRADESGHHKRLLHLQERAEGQNELIETLTEEAQEARALSREVRERDLEIERLHAEIGSKDDLVHALRRQVAKTGEFQATVARQDEVIARQEDELAQKQTDLERAGDELDTLGSELEARKALVESLREDAERANELESQLEAKREAIRTLEATVNRHVETNAELRRTVEAWKQKYQAAKGALLDDESTTVEVPNLTDTEINALQELESDVTENAALDATAAVNMRAALGQARSQKANSRA